ncbi:MAG: tRNA (adenosine(37)-N6)-dimethylallyltransferase MiaA [Clostridiales Family XIII bacterium]|nr:tRNA (adenosine(37)-N6)-dimethylallyltransferase MiaA [Clostridiales Family XIII bacterium]
MSRREVIFVVGPTAVGKSAFAVDLARKTDGEIVSADSMQVYRGLDKGTAKPTKIERETVPHHMIDIIDPWEEYSAAAYRDEAIEVIEDIFERGNTPIVCGGSGLYVHSLLYGLDFSGGAGDPALRESLVREAEDGGALLLYKKLEELDPDAALRIHPNNVKKVIRAIERVSGTLENQGVREFDESFAGAVDFETRVLRLTMERPKLYERIERRVDDFLAGGLEGEVRGLLAAGVPPGGTAMQGIGYKEIVKFFDGDIDYNEAVRLIKQNSRRYAKRQETWFKRYEQAEVIVVE